MNKGFVSYEIAQALKEAGFDWKCKAFYWTDDGSFKETNHDAFNNRYSNCSTMVAAPTLAQAHKWLISKGIFVEVSCFGIYCGKVPDWSYELVNTTTGDYLGEYLEVFKDYNTTLSAGIAAALKLIENSDK